MHTFKSKHHNIRAWLRALTISLSVFYAGYSLSILNILNQQNQVRLGHHSKFNEFYYNKFYLVIEKPFLFLGFTLAVTTIIGPFLISPIVFH